MGEPRSLPFEQAKISGRAKAYLSYEDSTSRLRELVPLLEELAKKQSMFDLLVEKTRATGPIRVTAAPANSDPTEWWDFLEGVVEAFDTHDHLIAEFRRASRHILKASHAVFFLLGSDGFRADRGTSFVPLRDPVVAYFETHPAVVDGGIWESKTDPVAELAMRNYLALWGARLVVPIHDNGRLLGLISLGVRYDGHAYDEADRSRAIAFARLLRHFLGKSAEFTRLRVLSEQAGLWRSEIPGPCTPGARPRTRACPRDLPLAVRDLDRPKSATTANRAGSRPRFPGSFFRKPAPASWPKLAESGPFGRKPAPRCTTRRPGNGPIGAGFCGKSGLRSAMR